MTLLHCCPPSNSSQTNRDRRCSGWCSHNLTLSSRVTMQWSDARCEGWNNECLWHVQAVLMFSNETSAFQKQRNVGQKDEDFAPVNEDVAWKQQELTHQHSVLRLVSFDLQFDSLPQRQLHLPPHCIPHTLCTEKRREEMKYRKIHNQIWKRSVWEDKWQLLPSGFSSTTKSNALLLHKVLTQHRTQHRRIFLLVFISLAHHESLFRGLTPL